MALSPRVTRAGAVAAAASVLLLAIAGCSSTPGGSSDTIPTLDPKTKVTLSFDIQTADPKNNSPQVWSAVQEFMKENPNITVNLTGEATDEHTKKMQLAGQTDTLPDMFWILDADARDLNSAGKLVNVKPILDQANLTKYYPASTVKGFTQDGKMYGQPSSQLVTGMWYNSKILKDNGLTVPVTFDDLLHVVGVLHAKGITTISNGANQATFACWNFLRDLSAFGWDDKVKGLLDGSVKYDNPDFKKLYDHIDELRKAGAFADNVSTTTYDQIVSRFTSGDAAMVDGGLWMADPIQKSGIAADAGFWIGPEFKDGVGDQKISMSVPAAPWAYSAKSAKDPAKFAAIAKWVEFWAGQAAAQTQVDGALPPSTTWDVKVPDSQSVFKTGLAAAFATGTHAPANQPDLMVPTAVATAMHDSIYGVIQGQMTPDQALAYVQKALDDAQ
jgi:raffinose/stachyose/melibiose transport system substrate-binding protein